MAEGEDAERREKLSAQASLLGESRAQAEAGLAEKEALRPTAFEPVADWPTFVTMMAHKMGNDTAFVLCASPRRADFRLKALVGSGSGTGTGTCTGTGPGSGSG